MRPVRVLVKLICWLALAQAGLLRFRLQLAALRDGHRRLSCRERCWLHCCKRCWLPARNHLVRRLCTSCLEHHVGFTACAARQPQDTVGSCTACLSLLRVLRAASQLLQAMTRLAGLCKQTGSPLAQGHVQAAGELKALAQGRLVLRHAAECPKRLVEGSHVVDV